MNEYKALLDEYLSTIDDIEKRIDVLRHSDRNPYTARLRALREQRNEMRYSARMIQRYVT